MDYRDALNSNEQFKPCSIIQKISATYNVLLSPPADYPTCVNHIDSHYCLSRFYLAYLIKMYK